MVAERWRKGGDDCGNNGHNGAEPWKRDPAMVEGDSLNLNVKHKGLNNGGNTKKMHEMW